MKINWFSILFSFLFYHGVALISNLFEFHWYIFPESLIMWFVWVILFYFLLPPLFENPKPGTLQLSYNKKLTQEQIKSIEKSLQGYLQGINEQLKINQKYEIVWILSNNETSFKVYNVPHKVGNLAINYMKYLAGKF